MYVDCCVFSHGQILKCEAGSIEGKPIPGAAFLKPSSAAVPISLPSMTSLEHGCLVLDSKYAMWEAGGSGAPHLQG